MERSKLEQNTLGENHGTVAPMEIETTAGPDVEVNCLITGDSSPRQNDCPRQSNCPTQSDIGEENEIGVEHASSQLAETAVVESDMHEFYLPADYLHPLESSIQENNDLREVHAWGTENIPRELNPLSEAEEQMMSDNSHFGSVDERNDLMGSRDTRSGVQENNDLSEVHACGTENLPRELNPLSEAEEQMMSDNSHLGSVAERNDFMGSRDTRSDVQENNDLREVHAWGTENIPRELNPLSEAEEQMMSDNSHFGSVVERNDLMGSRDTSSDVQENYDLREVHACGTENLPRELSPLSEAEEQMMSDNGHFGSVDVRNDLMGSMDTRSDVQESWLLGKCSNPELNKLELQPELEFENEQGKPTTDSMEIGGSDAQKKCQVVESSCPKQIGLVEKREDGAGDVGGPPTDSKVEGPDSIYVELTPEVAATKNSMSTTVKEKVVSLRSVKRKYILRSSAGSPRILRSRSGRTSKPVGSTSTTQNVIVSDARKGKRKRRTLKKASNDEYSKIRKHVRYFLNRMGYERSLIDAYAGEGWKGQSIEKIKPEMELQRATSEILRCKRRIRDLFQQLDSLCAEGRLQESLFDSEGEIDSEDIFCAKCRSKDLTADNDILLCDGICDRGFHQMCLEPPLLKEEIPPGDEGWLCPGCDCKVDSINLLNDFQGTDLSIDDSWEKVFPEAAATEAGNMLDENLGFPSDDSEDNDYDPDGPQVDGTVDTEEGSTSDESDFTSASDELNLTSSPLAERYIALSSDDSEDNDFDPDAPDLDENVNKESSSSDFTSDPESFDAETSGGGEIPVHSIINGGKLVSGLGKRTKVSKVKKQSLSSELQLLQDDLPGTSSPVSGRRQIERLDYKKLHDVSLTTSVLILSSIQSTSNACIDVINSSFLFDLVLLLTFAMSVLSKETYGNVPSDSSDEEDWADADIQKKKVNDGHKKVSGQSPKETSPTAPKKSPTVGGQSNSKRSKNIPKKRTRQKLEFDGANNSANPTKQDGSLTGCSGKNSSASGSRRLGDAVTERLLDSLKENEYPSRETKESLARELGITFKQKDRALAIHMVLTTVESLETVLGAVFELLQLSCKSSKKPIDKSGKALLLFSALGTHLWRKSGDGALARSQ
ncbi:hypothetical protein Sjap_022757 [Stephania japonica]|uniref:PHD-type domain-containing protein n=1 Tax=Stephania japonica TaxID=461633 RepID=A0AAP0HV91_9MAGN